MTREPEHFEEEKIDYSIRDRVSPVVKIAVYASIIFGAALLLYVWKSQ